jgi:adenine-specific DNA methylase
MGFKNRLENAYYELTAPAKQELIIDSKKLDENIDDNSILQESINKLINKIKQSTT